MDFSDIGSGELSASVSSESCLWDLGASCCTITSDLLPHTFLNSALHDPHRDRGTGRFMTQVEGVFAFTGSTVKISTIFHAVTPCARLHIRSGVFLGQAELIDNLHFSGVPRALLPARGEDCDSEYWCGLRSLAYADGYGKVIS